MRKLIILSLGLMMMWSCKSGGDTGELEGVADRPQWFEPEPYGMVFVKMGSFMMGPSDEDVPFALTAQSKTVSIDPFWMDQTEITNNEYRQFVYWVRDSMARRLLVKAGIEGYKADLKPEQIDEDEYDHDDVNTCFLNWDEEIRWDDDDAGYRDAIRELYLPVNERFNRRKEFDSRKLIYEYYWIDLKQAALKSNQYIFNNEYTGGEYRGEVINSKGEQVPIKDRSSFIMSGRINVYPDTLVWMSDYTYSYNEPWANKYFWHTAFDEYPVVGVNWVQANAFAVWRTNIMNTFLVKNGTALVENYRLPTEAEWEYAARGDLALAKYPWGGPYPRNKKGCFVANFKPLRGNYGDDGGNRTLTVGSFEPNDYGLYDMAGNVSEWTSNAFDESAYSFTHDLNPDFTYNALKSDPPALKRKATRGGSWKDIGYYLQNGVRAYEYQDTAKSYIGFRCVRAYMGRDIDDWGGSQIY